MGNRRPGLNGAAGGNGTNGNANNNTANCFQPTTPTGYATHQALTLPLTTALTRTAAIKSHFLGINNF